MWKKRKNVGKICHVMEKSIGIWCGKSVFEKDDSTTIVSITNNYWKMTIPCHSKGKWNVSIVSSKVVCGWLNFISSLNIAATLTQFTSFCLGLQVVFFFLWKIDDIEAMLSSSTQSQEMVEAVTAFLSNIRFDDGYVRSAISLELPPTHLHTHTFITLHIIGFNTLKTKNYSLKKEWNQKLNLLNSLNEPNNQLKIGW